MNNVTTNTNGLFEGEILKPVNPLQHLEDKAVRAHNWTSFSPDVRGKSIINDYGSELLEDMAELRQDANVTEENISDYKARYERLFSSYLGAKSNTFSAMITGPAKFNTRKHTKANRSEKRHYEIFREWRTRAKKAIIRKAQPVKTFVSELDRYKAELEALKQRHELTKQGNKIIAKAKKTGEDITQYLTDTFNVQPHMIDWVKKFGFNTVNSNANIKRIEARIKELEAKESQREEKPLINYTFEGGTMCINYEVDRIQITFTTRPTKEELTEWKKKGLNTFNWSPSANAWQRKITANAMYCIKRMLTNIKKVA
jgi:hypothetical protein